MKFSVLVGLLCFELCATAISQYAYHKLENPGFDEPLHPSTHGHNPFIVQTRHHSRRAPMHLDYLGYESQCGGASDGNRNMYGMQRYRSGSTPMGMHESCDRLFGLTGPTANDEPANLIRPCHLDDWNCVRDFLAANSNCKPVPGHVEDPLRLDVFTFNMPAANMKATLPNMQIRGLSTARMQEFYANKKTGNVVLAMNLAFLNETTSPSYFRYQRVGKESIVLSGYATIQFEDVTLTAIIPNLPNLRLDLAEIHIYFGSSFTPVYIAPGATNSRDPEVLASLATLYANLPILAKEGNKENARIITSILIQQAICDFGLQIVSL